jgi:hypothetical protein
MSLSTKILNILMLFCMISSLIMFGINIYTKQPFLAIYPVIFGIIAVVLFIYNTERKEDS